MTRARRRLRAAKNAGKSKRFAPGRRVWVVVSQPPYARVCPVRERRTTFFCYRALFFTRCSACAGHSKNATTRQPVHRVVECFHTRRTPPPPPPPHRLWLICFTTICREVENREGYTFIRHAGVRVTIADMIYMRLTLTRSRATHNNIIPT